MTKLAKEYFKNKGWRYFLQGSRSKDFLGTYSTPESDWDYYLDDSQHNNFPAYSGFSDWTALETLDYQDASTTLIFEKQFPDGKVQVSLRKSYDHMCKVWSAIPEDFYGKYLNKRSESYLGKDFTADFLDVLYFLGAHYENP